MKNLLDMKKIVMAGILSAFLSTGASAINYRSVVNVENVSVETPVGNAPRLPYMLWVNYSDGKGEYRQVKWLNSSEATENAEANPKINPAGTIYKVRGFIVGDNTTPNGYPVWAQVTVTDKASPVPDCKAVAETLPLNQVSIDGENRLTWNRNLDITIGTPMVFRRKAILKLTDGTRPLQSSRDTAQATTCRRWRWPLPAVRTTPRKRYFARTSSRW